ncbi:MAG: hypothetical protein K1X79_11650 [Oligoflexia bacterium]|nr:hypothetical protein [Oligoflexia bacterium]
MKKSSVFKLLSLGAALLVASLSLAEAPTVRSSSRPITRANSPQEAAPSKVQPRRMLVEPGVLEVDAEENHPAEQRSDTRQIIKEYAAPEYESIRRDGFFGKNAASTVFSPRVEYKVKPEIQYFPATHKQSEEEEELTPEQVVVSGKSDEAKKVDLTNSEGIIEAFGDPGEDDKILAEEKAPPSYKGMMAALELGDRKLAWKYARRYARRVRELGSRSTYIMGLTGKAFEREGVLPKDGWQSSPQFSEQQKLLDEDLKESGALEAEKSRIAKLDPSTRAFLQQAQEAEEKSGAASLDTPKVAEQPASAAADEATARAQVRSVLAGKVPVDPKGLVDIYFFLRPRDSASLAAAAEVEKFFREASLKPGVHFVGLTMEAANPIEVDDFRRRTGVTFSIQSGGALASQFRLRNSPVTIFVTQTTSKVVIEEGARPAYYLDEVLRLMQGR